MGFRRINSICCAGVGVQTNNGQPGAGHCKLSKLSKWLQILDKPKLFIVLAAAADDKQGNIFLHDSRCSSDGRNAGPMLATNWGTGSHHGPSVTATVSVAWHWLEFSKFDINVYRQYAQKVEKVFTLYTGSFYLTLICLSVRIPSVPKCVPIAIGLHMFYPSTRRCLL